jgi:hypothetical protein
MPEISISDVLCLYIAPLIYKPFAGKRGILKEESVAGEKKANKLKSWSS